MSQSDDCREPGAALKLRLVRDSQGPPPDGAAIRVAAYVRVGAAVALGAVGSVPAQPSGTLSQFFLLLGLIWTPWACVILFAADRPDRRLVLIGGPASDVLALFAVQWLVPGFAGAALAGYLVVVGFTAYTLRPPGAWLMAAASLSLAAVAAAFGPATDRVDAPMLGAIAVAMVATVALVDRTRLLNQRVAARSSRMEGKADAVLARVADGVVVTDAAGGILECNPAAERIVGLDSENVVGRGCAAVLGLRIGEQALDCSGGCPLLGLAGRDEVGLGLETWRLDSWGRRQPLLANAEAVCDDRGRVLEVVHSLRDVTRLKQAEEAKNLFLATSSHELKTPLTVIKGFADMLLTFPDVDSDRRREALAAVSRRADELGEIIERLLLSSRIEAGRVEVKMVDVSLSAVLNERVGALVGATGREILTEWDETLPHVAADPHGLVTVVDHLLDNALKYSPNRAPVVVRAVEEGDVVRLVISDSGIGMDSEQAAHCTDKFWQAESTDVRRFGGTGIGLYIVRSLVEAMGGRIEVESAPGSGTTFGVLLARAGTSPQPPGALSGEASSIREFMRQIGVPERASR